MSRTAVVSIILLSAVFMGPTLAQDSRPTVKISSRGHLLIDDRAVFVRGWYSDGTIEKLRRMAAAKFNAVIDYGFTERPIADTRRYLDEARRLGVMVFGAVHDVYPSAPYRKTLGVWRGNREILEGVVAEFRDHPAIVAWYTNDEILPENVAEMKAHAVAVKKLDPSRPHLIVHERAFDLAAFSATAEIFGIDDYPIPARGADGFGKVFAEARKLLDARPDGPNVRPLWAVLQNFAWYQHRKPATPVIPGDRDTDRARQPSAEEWQTGRPPTEAECAAMTWSAICRGADGLFYWCLYNLDYLPDRKDRWDAASRLNAEVAAVEADLLRGQRHTAPCDDPLIETTLLRSKGRDLLIAVNPHTQPIRATITLTNSDIARARVLFEERTVAAAGGRILDFFPPHGRHVYLFEPPADDR